MDQETEYETEIRPMLCKLNAHTRCDGSAMFTQGMAWHFRCHRTTSISLVLIICLCNIQLGETTVTASVLGPLEGKLHSLQIDKAYVEVYYRSKSGLPTASDKLREKIIRNTCETAILAVLYPRSGITIQIYEMEDGGGVRNINQINFIIDSHSLIHVFIFFCPQLIACSVNAACLALLNSGLSMKMLVGGVHCIITADGDLVLDPSRDQCDKARASLTFVFDSIDKNIVSAHTTGKFTIGEYNDAVFQCQRASDVVFKFYRNALKKFHKC